MNLSEVATKGAIAGTTGTKNADKAENVAEETKNTNIFEGASDYLHNNLSSLADFGASIANYTMENSIPSSIANITEDLKNGDSIHEALGNEASRKMENMSELGGDIYDALQKYSENSFSSKVANFIKDLFS